MLWMRGARSLTAGDGRGPWGLPLSLLVPAHMTLPSGLPQA